MKKLILFAVATFIGFVTVFYGLQHLIKKTVEEPVLRTPIPTATSEFSIEKPPSNSLVGQITALTGNVSWQSRVATEPARITEFQPIQQGERLVTKIGRVTTEFPENVTFSLSSDSDLDIVQTLPESIVFKQSEGTVTYERSGDSPISIRTLHLLLDMELGKISVTTEYDEKLVIVKVTSGKVTVAYNDLDLETQMVLVEEGEVLTFNDATRRVRIR